MKSWISRMNVRERKTGNRDCIHRWWKEKSEGWRFCEGKREGRRSSALQCINPKDRVMLSILSCSIVAGSDTTKSQCKHHIESTSTRSFREIYVKLERLRSRCICFDEWAVSFLEHRPGFCGLEGTWWQTDRGISKWKRTSRVRHIYLASAGTKTGMRRLVNGRPCF